MKTLPRMATALPLAALMVAPAFARQTTTTTTTQTMPGNGSMGAMSGSNKPMTVQDPSTGKTVFVVPASASGADKEKASWLYNNLDDREMRRFHARGLSDSTIKGAANLAMQTGLPMDYIVDRIVTSGYSLVQVASTYGVPIGNLNADLPGMGASSYALVSPDMYAPPAPYAMNTMTSTSVSAAMPTPSSDIVAVLSADPRFSTLVSAIRSAGLTSSLQGPGPYTLFAPTNDAFAKLPAGALDDLMLSSNRSKLSSILLYHVVSGKIAGSDVLAMSAPGTPKSLEGDSLTVTNVAPLKVNDANIIATDIPASNGVIHAIDSVLMPPSMTTAPSTTTTPTPVAPLPAPVEPNQP